MKSMQEGEAKMTASKWERDFKSYIGELQMPRDDYKGIMAYIEDGAKLLKAQKPVKPYDGSCGSCGTYLMRGWIACPICGKKVYWK